MNLFAIYFVFLFFNANLIQRKLTEITYLVYEILLNRYVKSSQETYFLLSFSFSLFSFFSFSLSFFLFLISERELEKKMHDILYATTLLLAVT